MTASLNRQRFVDAALEVIADVGVERASMRKVAAQLGVSAMAMYKHFNNKEALLAAAFDTFIERADVLPAETLAWDGWLEQLARNMYGALSGDRRWLPLLGSLPLGSNALKVTDQVITKLQAAGFSADQAVRIYMAMIQLVVGAASLRATLYRASEEGGDEALSAVTHSYLQDPSRQRLHVAPVLETIVREEPIDISLPYLLDGFRQQLSAATPSPR